MIRIGSDTDIGMNRNEFESDTFARELLLQALEKVLLDFL